MKLMNKFGFGLFLIFVIILFTQNVSALGVTPARKIVDFEPGALYEVEFSIVNNEHKEMDVAVFVEGELADRIKLDKNYLKFNANEELKSIKYTFSLPNEMLPGTRETKILIKELPPSMAHEGAIVTASVSLTYQLQVQVPYPGKYATIELKTVQTGKTDHVSFLMPVNNFGTQDIVSVKGIIDIYGPTNEKITTINTVGGSVKSQERIDLTATWIGEINPGKYFAKGVAIYDGETTTEVEKVFNVGEIDIIILEIRVNEDFRLGDIAKFNILLENKWAEELKEVYAEMVVYTLDNKEVIRFRSATEPIAALGKQELIAYWDTAGIKEGEYKTTLILHYDGNTKEEELKTTVSLNDIKFSAYGVTGQVAYSGESSSVFKRESTWFMVVLILVGINVFWFVYFKKRKKSSNNNNLGNI